MPPLRMGSAQIDIFYSIHVYPNLPKMARLCLVLFPTEVAQNNLEQPTLPNFQLFHFFPTEAAQND